jgi:hypothetical protein
MERITTILDVLGTALDALVNLGQSDSRILRGNRGLITNLPPLPIPPVRAPAPPQPMR